MNRRKFFNSIAAFAGAVVCAPLAKLVAQPAPKWVGTITPRPLLQSPPSIEAALRELMECDRRAQLATGAIDFKKITEQMQKDAGWDEQKVIVYRRNYTGKVYEST